MRCVSSFLQLRVHEVRDGCDKTAVDPSTNGIAQDAVPAAMKGLSDFVLSQPVGDVSLSVPTPRPKRTSAGDTSEASRAPDPPPPDPDLLAKKARAELLTRASVVSAAEDESASLAARVAHLSKENSGLRAEVSDLQRQNDALTAELKAFKAARTW